MIVKSRQELAGSDLDVAWGNGSSIRLLTESDGRPFTVTHTTVQAGSESHMCYERHCEACYCIDGEGELVLESGETFQLKPGTLYSPDEGEPHRVRARSEIHVVCVFTPPLVGDERHALRPDGYSSY